MTDRARELWGRRSRASRGAHSMTDRARELVEELQIASRNLRALRPEQKQGMWSASGFSANACSHLFAEAADFIEQSITPPEAVSEGAVRAQLEVRIVEILRQSLDLSRELLTELEECGNLNGVAGTIAALQSRDTVSGEVVKRAYIEGHRHGRANPPVYQSAEEDWQQSRSRAAIAVLQSRVKTIERK